MESKENIQLRYKLVQGKKLSKEELLRANIEASKRVEASKSLRQKDKSGLTAEITNELQKIKDPKVMNEYKLDILSKQLINLENKKTKFELKKQEGVARYKEKSMDLIIQEIKDAIKEVKEQMKAINFGKEEE